MASGVFRRSVRFGLGLISRKRNVLDANIVKCRRICSSTACYQKYYSSKHEWLDIPDGSSEGTVGITDYAQDQLGEVVYVELPDVGKTLEANDEAGVLESVKAASDVYTPVSGEISDVNSILASEPTLINNSPFDEGWLFKIKISDPSELENLMDEDGYEEFKKEDQ